MNTVSIALFEFSKSRAISAMLASVVHEPTCPRANVSKARQLLIFTCQHADKRANKPTYQRRANYLTWCANVIKTCQFFNLTYFSFVERRNDFLTFFQKNNSIFDFFNYA